MMHSTPILASAVLAIIVFGAGSACTLSKGNPGDSIEIKDRDFDIADGSDGKEITIFDSDFNAESPQDGKIKSQKREEINRQGNGSSTVSTMFDGAGNRTDARIFNNHSRLRKVIIRTGVDKDVQVFVYGNNGSVKRLVVKTADDVLKATGDEIANAAKIYETREQRDQRREETAKNRAQEVKSAEAEKAQLRRTESDETNTIQPDQHPRDLSEDNQQ